MLSGFEDEDASAGSRWGLLTDVQPPDLETRIAILRKKAIQERLSVPDDVLEFIASRISTNIRELEGALIRVTAFANLNRQPVDMSLAEIVLRDLMPDDASRQVTPATIMAQTAAYFGLTLTTCRASPAHGCSSPPARSPCTCAASSPTCRCRRSGSSSAGATTPP
jgi:chromosomal replication initiator protein